MKKTLYLSGAFVLSVFVFAAISGENNKVDLLIAQYFDGFWAGNYRFLCEEATDKDLNQCQDELFLIDEALFNRFDIVRGEEFKVFTRKNVFWIPFLTGNKVSVDVRLHSESACDRFFCLNGRYGEDYAKNTFFVSRDAGQWKMSGLKLNDSLLKRQYLKVKTSVDFDEYIETTEKGRVIKRIEVDVEKTDSLNHRLLLYSLEKVLRNNKK